MVDIERRLGGIKLGESRDQADAAAEQGAFRHLRETPNNHKKHMMEYEHAAADLSSHINLAIALCLNVFSPDAVD